MAWLLILFIVLLSWTLWTGYCLLVNYKIASQIGLPIVTSPIAPLNPFQTLFGKSLIPLLKSLPWGLGAFARYNHFGWGFDDKYYMHKELGPAFIQVSPGQSILYVADAEAVEAIVSQWKDFPKPIEIYKPLAVFGHNVDTVEGEDWQRHRKITTISFNERNSNLVWVESLRQARDVLHSWVEYGEMGTNQTAEDITTLALHVLTGAGFGISYSFKTGLQTSQPGHSMTYRDALQTILQNGLFVFIFPHRLLTSSFSTKKMRTIGYSILEFKKYMEEMVKREKGLISRRDIGAGNLMSSLVRASEEANESPGKGSINRGLSEEEIYGNLFFYNLAGHETTANTLSYCILLLAAYPEWQAWLAEEISQVLGGQEGIETWEYQKVFPQLKRCLALMFETLRLYGPVTAIPKHTSTRPQSLSIDNKQYTVPPNTLIFLNTIALHTLPRYWGSDSLLWRPTRWISSSPSTPIGNETLQEPAKGTYIPWAEGHRVCPGRKFSQVEFVAVVAVLFGRYKVYPVLLEGESSENAKERILKTIEKSHVEITLQMKNPRSVALKWTRRD